MLKYEQSFIISYIFVSVLALFDMTENIHNLDFESVQRMNPFDFKEKLISIIFL